MKSLRVGLYVAGSAACVAGAVVYAATDAHDVAVIGLLAGAVLLIGAGVMTAIGRSRIG